MKGYAGMAAGLAGLLLIAGGCAGVGARVTVEQLNNARAAVDSAEKAGAKKYTPDSLRQARDALAIASDAYANQVFERALAFAKKATRSALVARARSEQKSAEQKLTDLQARSSRVQAKIDAYMPPTPEPCQITPTAKPDPETAPAASEPPAPVKKETGAQP